MNGDAIFDALSEPTSRRVGAGLARVAQVLRSQEWRSAEPDGVAPTQVQALRALREGRGERGGMRLSALAAQLGVSVPTASARVDALVARGLVEKVPGADKRSLALRLSAAGGDVLERADARPDAVTEAVDALDPDEQADLLGSLVKVVRTLQVQGHVAPQRICVTCRSFRPFAHPGAALAHHCAYVDAPFGRQHLRLACGEHEDAPGPQQEELWARFTAGDPGTP